MPGPLLLENFRAGVDDVHAVGVSETQDVGVIDQISTAFGYDGGNLKDLIGVVAPHAALAENIEHATQTLANPDVQVRLGLESQKPAKIAHDWVLQAGLQTQVLRPLMQPSEELELPEVFDAAIETEGVVRWMDRMAAIATDVAGRTTVKHMVLGYSARIIGGAEHVAVPAGTPVNRYMGSVLVPQLTNTGLFKAVDLIGTDTKDGNSVMANAVNYVNMAANIDLASAHILAPTVAGNWAQKGAQMRKAFQAIHPDFDRDPENRQLWVASDEFPVGVTGEEPKETYQNPLSAIGNILRSAKYLDELR